MKTENTSFDIQGGAMSHPVGIVLCGGDSSRMRRDKALLDYHGMPQWQYVHNMLAPLCETVHLSLNARQAAQWKVPGDIGVVEDAAAYLHHGPMTGILSAWAKVGDKPIFVVACDYPLLKTTHLFDLYHRRSADRQIVCFRNAGRPEPLIAIFESSARSNLQAYFDSSRDSLSKFISQANTAYIDVSNPGFLQNVNDAEALKSIKNRMNHD